MNFYFAVKKT